MDRRRFLKLAAAAPLAPYVRPPELTLGAENVLAVTHAARFIVGDHFVFTANGVWRVKHADWERVSRALEPEQPDLYVVAVDRDRGEITYSTRPV